MYYKKTTKCAFNINTMGLARIYQNNGNCSIRFQPTHSIQISIQPLDNNTHWFARNLAGQWRLPHQTPSKLQPYTKLYTNYIQTRR